MTKRAHIIRPYWTGKTPEAIAGLRGMTTREVEAVLFARVR